jgi:hypothetical protein
MPEISGIIASFEATAAMTTLNRFVKLTSGKLVLCTAGVKAVGVIKAAGAAGEMVPVDVSGIALVEVGSGGVTENLPVSSDSTGQAVLTAAIAAAITSGTIAMTGDAANAGVSLTGGKLPSLINGFALDTVAEHGFARIRLA